MIGSTVCFMHVALYGMLYRTARSRFHPNLPSSQLLPCLIISHTRPRMKSPQTYAIVSSLSSCVSPGSDLLCIVVKDKDELRDDVDVEPHVSGDGIIGTYLVWNHWGAKPPTYLWETKKLRVSRTRTAGVAVRTPWEFFSSGCSEI